MERRTIFCRFTGNGVLKIILKNGRNRRLPSEIAIRPVRLQSDEGRERKRGAGNGDCNLARGQSWVWPEFLLLSFRVAAIANTFFNEKSTTVFNDKFPWFGELGQVSLVWSRDCYKMLRNLPEMQKVADAADISVLFFSAGANFWAVLGHFWSIWG